MNLFNKSPGRSHKCLYRHQWNMVKQWQFFYEIGIKIDFNRSGWPKTNLISTWRHMETGVCKHEKDVTDTSNLWLTVHLLLYSIKRSLCISSDFMCNALTHHEISRVSISYFVLCLNYSVIFTYCLFSKLKSSWKCNWSVFRFNRFNPPN